MNDLRGLILTTGLLFVLLFAGCSEKPAEKTTPPEPGMESETTAETHAEQEQPTPPELTGIQKDFQEFVKHARLREVDEATQALREMIVNYPEESVSLYGHLSQFYLNSNMEEKAFATIEEALDEHPGNPGLRHLKGRMMAFTGKDDEAIEIYEAIVADGSASQMVYRDLGDAYRKKGNLDKAIEYLEEFAQRSPGNISAYRKIKDLYLELGNVDKAIEAFRKTVDAQEGDLDTHRKYQEFVIEHGRRDQLIDEYEDRLEEKPQSALLHYLHGRILEETPAIEFEFDLASQLDPDWFWPHYALGIHHYLLGDYQTAREHIIDASNTGGREVLYSKMYLTLLDIAQGDYEQARHRARRVLKKHPGIYEIYDLMLRSYLEDGDCEGARELAREVMEEKPKGPQFGLRLQIAAAVECGTPGLVESLISKFNQTYKLEQTDAEKMIFIHARAKAQKGEYEAARDLLLDASKDESIQSSEVFFWLAVLLENTGHQEHARRVFRSVKQTGDNSMDRESVFFGDAAAYWLGEIDREAFAKTFGYSPYRLSNDYWAILAMKAKQSNETQKAQRYFDKALEVTRGSEFPARLIDQWR